MDGSHRILILNYEYPPLGGGAGMVTRHMAEGFAALGHKVHVVTTWFPGEPEFISEENLSIMRLRSLRRRSYKSNPWEMNSWIRHAIRYFNQLSEEPMFDVCLANFTMPGGVVARYLLKKWNIPYVILSHGHDIPWFAPKQMLFWHILCYRWIKKAMLDSRYNILLTDELKKVADNFLGSKFSGKNIVIPNGLLIEQCRTGFNTPESKMNILFVGRMVEQKDPITFIKACKILNEMNIEAHFTLIGDGPLKETAEKLILKWDIQNIEILGKVSHYKVLTAYEEAHVLILPSREEAMSLVVLEAVARGLYTITTPVSGNTDLIKPGVNGEFVGYGDARDIANKVAEFYYEKYLKSYQYPKLMVDELYRKYNWDKVINEYIEIFKLMKPSPMTSSKVN